MNCIVLFGASAPVGCIEEGLVCLLHSGFKRMREASASGEGENGSGHTMFK